MLKFCGILFFVFIVVISVLSLILGSWGSAVVGTALGVVWTVRLVAAIILSFLIAAALD
jgi:hypothetical protein